MQLTKNMNKIFRHGISSNKNWIFLISRLLPWIFKRPKSEFRLLFLPHLRSVFVIWKFIYFRCTSSIHVLSFSLRPTLFKQIYILVIFLPFGVRRAHDRNVIIYNLMRTCGEWRARIHLHKIDVELKIQRRPLGRTALHDGRGRYTSLTENWHENYVEFHRWIVSEWSSMNFIDWKQWAQDTNGPQTRIVYRSPHLP